MLERISRVPLVGGAVRRFGEWRVAEKLREITPLLRRADRLLDVGSGNGILCAALRRAGHTVEALDVRDGSFSDDTKPTLYDGRRIPFPDATFDVALLVTCLHHIPTPDDVLAEAKRVAQRLIVVEEIYENELERLVTYAVDSVFNLEFVGHPHANKSDAGWRSTFDRLSLSITSVRYYRSFGVLRRVTYALEPASRAGAPHRASGPKPKETS